ncbi:MAG: hypothetical protein EP312_02345, partial [Gammaproteobacteria bacterium]
MLRVSFRHVITSALMLALVACTSSPPVATSPSTAPVAPAALPMPPVPEAAPVRQPNPAAAALIAQAESHRSRADFATASSLLERAVRIAPTEP